MKQLVFLLLNCHCYMCDTEAGLLLIAVRHCLSWLWHTGWFLVCDRVMDCWLIAVIRCTYPRRQLSSGGQCVKAVVSHYVSPQHFYVHQNERQQVTIVSKWIFCTFYVGNFDEAFNVVHSLSALTLLVGWQEGHLACKNWVARYWRSCLSGARCKWFAYGSANATHTPSSLAPAKSRLVYLSGAGLLSSKKAIKRM